MKILASTLAAAGMLAAFSMSAAWAAETASADILDNKGQKIGQATFTAAPEGVLLRLSVQGLPPGWHGAHFHAMGDCSDHEKFMASKGHVTHDDKPHGLLNAKGTHAGDLPNLYVHADGKGEAEMFTHLAMLEKDLLDADGSALVIHAGPDDHMTQPIGGAGDRIACGVIK
ncbi:superoxide dismutase family protein [Oceanibaculum pacificum]|nr:superoxide dismutase family protein [Oceanibaculum pacificum]